MSLTKTVGFVAVTTLAIGGAAFGTEQNNDTLAQIAELKAQIASLKGAENGQWLTEQRASEIRGIVTDVLADAETRSVVEIAEMVLTRRCFRKSPRRLVASTTSHPARAN